MKSFKNIKKQHWVAVPAPFLESISPVKDFIILHKGTLALVAFLFFALGWVYANRRTNGQ